MRTRLTIRPPGTLLGTLVWVCDEHSATPRVRARPEGFGRRLLNVRDQHDSLEGRDEQTRAMRAPSSSPRARAGHATETKVYRRRKNSTQTAPNARERHLRGTPRRTPRPTQKET